MLTIEIIEYTGSFRFMTGHPALYLLFSLVTNGRSFREDISLRGHNDWKGDWVMQELMGEWLNLGRLHDSFDYFLKSGR